MRARIDLVGRWGSVRVAGAGPLTAPSLGGSKLTLPCEMPDGRVAQLCGFEQLSFLSEHQLPNLHKTQGAGSESHCR